MKQLEPDCQHYTEVKIKIPTTTCFGHFLAGLQKEWFARIAHHSRSLCPSHGGRGWGGNTLSQSQTISQKKRLRWTQSHTISQKKRLRWNHKIDFTHSSLDNWTTDNWFFWPPCPPSKFLCRWFERQRAGSPTVPTPTSPSSRGSAMSNGFGGRALRFVPVLDTDLIWSGLKVGCGLWFQHDHFSRWVLERTVPEAFPPLSWMRCGRRSLRPMLSTSLGRKRLLCHSGFILFLLPPIHHPHCSDALYLATRGSARVLDKEGELGLLEVGAVADFLLVDMQGEFPLFWLLCSQGWQTRASQGN